MIENPKIVRRNVLHTTGNVVLVLVIIVILLFNYIPISAKALVIENTLDQ